MGGQVGEKPAALHDDVFSPSSINLGGGGGGGVQTRALHGVDNPYGYGYGVGFG